MELPLHSQELMERLGATVEIKFGQVYLIVLSAHEINVSINRILGGKGQKLNVKNRRKREFMNTYR